MDFSDKIQQIANRLKNNAGTISTEEATKQSLVLPMLQALGYDVFNPNEVMPEYIADVGIKKGEKVDYAIKRDNQTIMIIECKPVEAELSSNHLSQLYRYFGVSEAHFGVLTNGANYQFYSDLVEKNKMDSRPFFNFNLLDYDKRDLRELKKFAKENFELETILENAFSLKLRNSAIAELNTEFEQPSDEFIKLFAKRIFEGRLTQNVVDDLRDIIAKAFSDFVNAKIDGTLKSAMHRQEEAEETAEEEQNQNDKGIETTQEEIDGHLIVKAIAAKLVAPERVTMRDAKSYCAILLDDNNRKPICRLHFNHSQWYVGIVIDSKETRHPIDSVNDLYNFSDEMLAVISEYEK